MLLQIFKRIKIDKRKLYIFNIMRYIGYNFSNDFRCWLNICKKRMIMFDGIKL